MREYSLEKTRNIGIIAHIDAGKTTVTEGILYLTGKTHKIGTVHEGDTQMDWMEQERERGITITSAATTCFWKPKHYKNIMVSSSNHEVAPRPQSFDGAGKAQCDKGVVQGDNYNKIDKTDKDDKTDKIDKADKTYRINIIDTPGHIDFTAEVQRSLRVLDGAVVIFDGKMGVEPQSETVWHQADKFKVPRICFINKINQTGGDFYKSLESIKDRLNPEAYAVQLPIGFEKGICGVVDLVKMKAYTYKDFHDKELTEQEIPYDMKEKCEKFRHDLLEKVVEVDDKLTEKFLEDQEITEAEFVEAVRQNTLQGNFFPVFGGDGRGVIVETLLDAIINYLPSPLDLPEIEGTNLKTKEKEKRYAKDTEPFSALAFKIATDPYVGTLIFFRVYSGILSAGSYVLNATTNNKERIGRIVRLHANSREEVQEVYAGGIAAAVGLKNTTTGDTLCDPNHPIVLEQINFPEPVISVAIEPKTKQDQEKMGLALAKLAQEDPTFQIKSDEETAQTIISGMGELHLEILVDRMKREFNVEAVVGQPQVAYKETIRKITEAEGKYIRQSGGRGQYGHCWLRLEPQDRGAGFEFIDEIKGGVIPKEYIPAIKKGIKEAMDNGVIAGYPLIDLKAAVYDGSYHEVDSSEAAFKIAGSIALQTGVKQANPVILEPVMKIEVITPEEFMGDVIGDLNSKRAQVQEMKDVGNVKIIDAFVPLASMFGYATALRSLSQGRASYSMEFHEYREVPKNVAEEIIEGRQKK